MIEPRHSQTAPRFRRVRYALLALAVAGLGGLSLWQLFGPPPAVIVSRQTTFLTKPLAEDGLPDYGRALYAPLRSGTTPENNGARLFWMAVGQPKRFGDFTREEWAALYAELGIDAPIDRPLERLFEEAVEDRIAVRLAREQGVVAKENDPAFNWNGRLHHVREAASQLLHDAIWRPWTSEEIPEAGQWLAQNEAALDLIVEAVAKPRFYSPPINLLANLRLPLFDAGLSAEDVARSVAWDLTARAMNRIARQDFDGAQQDVRACFQLGSHIGRQPWLVACGVGIDIRNHARCGVYKLLADQHVPTELLDEIAKDLNDQPTSFDLAARVGRAQRLASLDCVINQLTDRREKKLFEASELSWASRLSVDPNIVLEICNQRYDQLEKIFALPTWQRRARIDEFWDELGKSFSSEEYSAAAILSRRRRSELVGDDLVMRIFDLDHMIDRANEDEAEMHLVRLAVGLERHRRRTGEYPIDLSALVPTEVAVLPNDPFSGKPLLYERRSEGYLLYSVGPNGVDDGGTEYGPYSPIVRGEWQPIESGVEIDGEKTDVVLRMPMPKPKPIASAP